MKPSIYLDYAAATPVDDAAIEAMRPYLSDNFYNPSAIYQTARDVRKAVECARATIASVLGSKDQEIIFTAGGTEANNLAIHGIMRRFPQGNIVVSGIEHESVLIPAKNYNHKIAPVKQNGLIDPSNLEKLIDDNTVLVSIMYANNEVGTVQPIQEIASFIAEQRVKRTQKATNGNVLPIYLHADACQASNYLDLQVSRLHVDLMTINGGKIYAPKQSGALYINKKVEILPLIQGGGQELSLRSGTENVPAIVAFATMLQKVQKERKIESQRIKNLANILFAKLSQNIPAIMMNGDLRHRLPNNLNFFIPNIDGELLTMQLDHAGLMVATGSACTASDDEPSHVLMAMGLGAERASSSLRITLGRQTTENNVLVAAGILTKVLSSYQD
jgi:cysteine desulfurase